MNFACGVTNWVMIDGNNEMTSFINPTPFNKEGDVVKVWTLLDFKSPQVSGDFNYLSLKEQNEIYCSENKFRSIGFWWYSGNMGGGKEIFAYNVPEQWKQITPKSLGASLWKAACGKQ